MRNASIRNFVFFAIVCVFLWTPAVIQAADSSPPESVVKLIFIHHSCGENWLADDNGGLGLALMENKYYVSDTNYGWGPNSIGDSTDIGHWWEWFNGAQSATYLTALYAESSEHSNGGYTRLSEDPGGENEIILFKSCFPNSDLKGAPDDSPAAGENPLQGQNAYSEYMTVANAKAIYLDLLDYFSTRQDKLFIAVTAPPLTESATDASSAANARALNNWLVDSWLADYDSSNVAVFHFYNVLTSNGGNAQTNDAGEEDGNHHRIWDGKIQHQQTLDYNFSAYASGVSDSHPTAAGNQKATDEFLPLFNVYYNQWVDASDSDSKPDVKPAITAVSGFLTPGSTFADCIQDGYADTQWYKIWDQTSGQCYTQGAAATSGQWVSADSLSQMELPYDLNTFSIKAWGPDTGQSKWVDFAVSSGSADSTIALSDQTFDAYTTLTYDAIIDAGGLDPAAYLRVYNAAEYLYLDVSGDGWVKADELANYSLETGAPGETIQIWIDTYLYGSGRSGWEDVKITAK